MRLWSTIKEKIMGKQREPQTYDYRHRYWGHDYTWSPTDGGKRGQATGWSNGFIIEVGDFLLLENHKNPDGGVLYRVTDISYYTDPHDMWNATLVWVPRDVTTLTGAPNFRQRISA